MKIDISGIPSKPGVYFFKDKTGKTIYIGKAQNLKNRVRSYFGEKNYDRRVLPMLDTAARVDFEETLSDIEALILESKYIKKLKPKFNILMRDDKQYFYVGFTKDTYSRIFLTHQTNNYKLKAKSFIGPFTDGWALKETLKLLRKIFPYCTCKQLHNRPCLNCHIGNCLGFCCLKQTIENNKQIIINKRTYRKNIQAIKDILEGKRTSIIRKLIKKMMSEAKVQNFEEAIKIQNQINRLRRIFANAQIIKRISHGEALEKLQKVFRLPNPPNRIEGYDISNIQGTNATGSMVVFTLQQSSGQAKFQPDKSEYRKFKIRLKKTPDDTFMLQEVINRRLNHPEWPYPDLMLIDGGKGQLNTVIRIMIARKKNIHLLSIAKGKQEIFSTTLKKPVPIAKLPAEVKNLIKHIDAEAHRFAIRYYRKLHRRKFIP